MNVTLDKGGSLEAGKILNYGTTTLEVKQGSNAEIGDFINSGATTIHVDETSTLQFASLEMHGGDGITFTGNGTFIIGNDTTEPGGEEAPSAELLFTVKTTDGGSAEAPEFKATVIDVTALNEEIFEFDTTALITLEFTNDILADIAVGDTKDLEILLIKGYSTFTIGDEALQTMIANTNYSYEEPLMTFSVAEEDSAQSSKYEVTDAKYEMRNNNLYWVGTLANNEAVPEPATASLSLLGLAALMLRRRRN